MLNNTNLIIAVVVLLVGFQFVCQLRGNSGGLVEGWTNLKKTKSTKRIPLNVESIDSLRFVGPWKKPKKGKNKHHAVCRRKWYEKQGDVHYCAGPKLKKRINAVTGFNAFPLKSNLTKPVPKKARKRSERFSEKRPMTRV